jgi:hypothetical protein
MRANNRLYPAIIRFVEPDRAIARRELADYQ